MCDTCFTLSDYLISYFLVSSKITLRNLYFLISSKIKDFQILRKNPDLANVKVIKSKNEKERETLSNI